MDTPKVSPGITVNIGGFAGDLNSYLTHQKTTALTKECLAELNVKAFKTTFPTTKGRKTFNPLHCIRKQNREAVLLFVDSLIKAFTQDGMKEITLNELIELYKLPSGKLKATYKKIVSRLGKLGVVAFAKGRGRADFAIKNIAIGEIAGDVHSPVASPADKLKEEQDKIELPQTQKRMIEILSTCKFDTSLRSSEWQIGEYILSVRKI